MTQSLKTVERRYEYSLYTHCIMHILCIYTLADLKIKHAIKVITKLSEEIEAYIK